MNTVVKVENLSKKYLIGHRTQDKYHTVRDGLAGALKKIGRGLIHPFLASAGPPTKGSKVEEFWALNDISFRVTQGERVGIIGRNGAGKSTLLKILSRITDPSRGRITLKGRVASLLEVGTGFHPELTGRENIFLNGAILGMAKTEIQRKFDEIVAFAEVERFLDTPIKRYSSGMHVRLAFAVAAHLEPEILIVDEVLAVGDVQFQKKCLGKMENVAREGRTIFFVSHNMGAIQRLTSRCLLLDHGRLQFDGTVGDGVSMYLESNFHPEAAQLAAMATRDPSLAFDLSLQDTGGKCFYRQPLKFSIVFYAKSTFRAITIALDVYNSIGARLLTARNNIGDITEGTGKFIFEVQDHHLPPGNYSFALAISSGKDSLFYQNHLIKFVVSDEGVDDPLLIPYLEHHRDKIGSFYELSYTREI